MTKWDVCFYQVHLFSGESTFCFWSLTVTTLVSLTYSDLACFISFPKFLQQGGYKLLNILALLLCHLIFNMIRVNHGRRLSLRSVDYV